MFKLFKGKKNTENNRPAPLPIEEKIRQILVSLLQKDQQFKPLDFSSFCPILKNINKGRFFSLIKGSDDFRISVLLTDKISEIDDSFYKQLTAIQGFEVIEYDYSPEDYHETLWSLSTKSIFASDDDSFFIFKDESNHIDNKSAKRLSIRHSREFIFGTLLIHGFKRNQTNINIRYNQLLFDQSEIKNLNGVLFSSTIQINKTDFQFIYFLEDTGKSTVLLAKELIKEQCSRIKEILTPEALIKQAGLLQEGYSADPADITLSGDIFTPGTDIPFKVIFPKKFINLFPDYKCTTVKGKILQINKKLFRETFDSFHLFQKEFLLNDYLSNLDHRDLNLICQNFFISHGYSGDKIKELFYFKVRIEEKSRLLKASFTDLDRFLDHLPVNLMEQYGSSKAYSDGYLNLIRLQIETLDLIYRDLYEGKLLLSYKSRFLLEKERGSREKENKTRRLRKLISEKKYINYLSTMENKKVQLLLSNMKNRLIVDTFIYQTDEFPKLKPFLSRRRYQELREDIQFTQGKVKSGQIDLNRICDSIEGFNSTIREFIKKERENQS
jgi:hypothetical protein